MGKSKLYLLLKSHKVRQHLNSLNLSFVFRHLRELFIDEGVLSLQLFVRDCQQLRKFCLGSQQRWHPTQYKWDACTIPWCAHKDSQQRALPPCLVWAWSWGVGLGTAHPAAPPQAVSCVWPEDARTASRHLPDTEIPAFRLEKWTAQPERQKSICWDSCSIKKHENLSITDRNKEQRC